MCQLGWRSRGGADSTANSKGAYCQSATLNWDGAVWSCFKKRLHGRDAYRGKKRPGPLLLALLDWLGQARVVGRGSDRPEGKQNQLENLISFLSDSSLCHASLPLSPSSRSSFPLFLYSWIAFMEERRQTWTEPWTQTLVNTSTYFSLFLLQSFPPCYVL